jgi:Outer membrane lipoprotein-sorting protein
MSLRARLVVLLLLFPIPLVSFEVPPFPFLGAAQAAPEAGGRQTPPGPALSADAIARRIDERDTGRDSRVEMRMRLVDRQGRARERALRVIGLRAASGRPPAQAGVGDRLLVRFTAPVDIAGTSFLVWERQDGDDERFLFLPALGRVRRIAGSERQESFVGSDFSYEDIGGRAIDDYAYAIADERASWTAGDGAVHPAWVLESRARDAHARYPRVLSTVRKDIFVVTRAEIFDRRNERAKEYRVRRLEPVQSIWTALDIEMVNHVERTRTELNVTSVRYDTGLTADDFSRRELERGVR